MRVRLVELRDADEIVRLGRAYADEAGAVLPHIEFDEELVRLTMANSVATAHPTIFVADTGIDLAGMMVASINAFYFMAGHFVQADIFYVHPIYRGTRAAALLLAELNTWSDLIGAKVTISGNANKLKTDKLARFHSRFGYQPAGLTLLRPKGA